MTYNDFIQAIIDYGYGQFAAHVKPSFYFCLQKYIASQGDKVTSYAPWVTRAEADFRKEFMNKQHIMKEA